MPLPLTDDVWCFIVGDDSTFPFNTALTRTVAYLKEAITAKIEYSGPAYNLTLYLVAIGQFYNQETPRAIIRKRWMSARS